MRISARYFIAALMASLVALAPTSGSAQDAEEVPPAIPGINEYLPPASSLPLAQQPLTGSLTVSAHLTEEAEPVPTGLVWRVFAPEPDESGKLPLVATAEGGEIGRASSRRGGGLQRSGISGH